VDLRLRDAAERADGARQLALQGAPIGDALGEVGHAPRRLVEQLHAGLPVERQAVLGEHHARLGDVGARHQHGGAAVLQAIADGVLGEIVGDGAGAAQLEIAVQGDVVGPRGPPAAQPEQRERAGDDAEAEKPAGAVHPAHGVRYHDRKRVGHWDLGSDRIRFACS